MIRKRREQKARRLAAQRLEWERQERERIENERLDQEAIAEMWELNEGAEEIAANLPPPPPLNNELPVPLYTPPPGLVIEGREYNIDGQLVTLFGNPVEMLPVHVPQPHGAIPLAAPGPVPGPLPPHAQAHIQMLGPPPNHLPQNVQAMAHPVSHHVHQGPPQQMFQQVPQPPPQQIQQIQDVHQLPAQQLVHGGPMMNQQTMTPPPPYPPQVCAGSPHAAFSPVPLPPSPSAPPPFSAEAYHQSPIQALSPVSVAPPSPLYAQGVIPIDYQTQALIPQMDFTTLLQLDQQLDQQLLQIQLELLLEEQGVLHHGQYVPPAPAAPGFPMGPAAQFPAVNNHFAVPTFQVPQVY